VVFYLVQVVNLSLVSPAGSVVQVMLSVFTKDKVSSVLQGFLPENQELDVKQEHGQLVVRGLFFSVTDTLEFIVAV
jgi:hypothetical protein